MSVDGIGRPKANIDWEKADEYLIAGCSGRELAALFGLQPNTIYSRCLEDHGITFTEYSEQRYAKGDNFIRKAQFEKAMEKDNTMLIWLGKNRLKQKDKEEVEQKFTPEALANLAAMMNQLDSVRSQRSIADSSMSDEPKS